MAEAFTFETAARLARLLHRAHVDVGNGDTIEITLPVNTASSLADRLERDLETSTPG